MTMRAGKLVSLPILPSQADPSAEAESAERASRQSPHEAAGERSRIALISPYGGGNLGDAAILESVIHGVRQRRPNAEIFALTLNPRVTTERHGIPAFPCAGLRLRSYGGAADDRSPRPDDTGRLARLVTAVPPLRKGRTLGRQVSGELRHRREARRFLEGFHDVVVAGGGQFDDLWGGAFGHPYVLWKWGTLAREAGARYAVLSVGVGVLRNRVSQMFIRRAMALAEYCSFRDAESLRLASFADVGRARVVPDLAYALPVERAIWDACQETSNETFQDSSGTTSSPTRRPLIAVSPLAYGDPRVWPEKDAAYYQHHVTSIAALCRGILARGWDIVFVSSDSPDAFTVRDVVGILDPQLTAEERTRIRTPETATLPALMRALASADLVVAGRLHGVLISHVLGKPVLALAYERKVTALMNGMEHQSLCLPARGLDAQVAMTKLSEMLERRAAWASDVRARVAVNRDLVDGQYDRLFGTPESASS
jgi:polysaccharide pyruvyl transferase WcaK-like protein